MKLFAVKGGIPNNTSSPNPEYYPLSFDLKTNIGYIGFMSRGWKFYTSSWNVISEYSHLCENNKFYFFGASFEICLAEAERVIGHKIYVINSFEIDSYKSQIGNNTIIPPSDQSNDEPDIFYFSHQLDSLIGLKDIKEEIYGLRAFAKVRAKKNSLGIPSTPSTLHMVFTGNPGTGKTTVARLIGKIYNEIGLLSTNNFIEVSRADLVGNHIGSTAIMTSQVFEKAKGGVLFIDEAYSLFKNESKDFGIEAIETLVKLMEDHRDSTVVIIAGYTKEINSLLNSNPGLKSRFSTYLHFPDFSKSELILILEKMIADIGHIITKSALIKFDFLIEENIDSGKFSGNARTIRTLFEKIQKLQATRLNKINNPSKEELLTFHDIDIPDSI